MSRGNSSNPYNGCICDRCGLELAPDDAIKLKTFVLDRTVDNTGRYRKTYKADLCGRCFDAVVEFIKPR